MSTDVRGLVVVSGHEDVMIQSVSGAVDQLTEVRLLVKGPLRHAMRITIEPAAVTARPTP